MPAKASEYTYNLSKYESKVSEYTHVVGTLLLRRCGHVHVMNVNAATPSVNSFVLMHNLCVIVFFVFSTIGCGLNCPYG